LGSGFRSRSKGNLRTQRKWNNEAAVIAKKIAARPPNTRACHIDRIEPEPDALSMNRGFVLDWFVFEDEDEHEDESVHGPKAFEKTKAGS
jgi:hypothetical protein